MLGNTFKVEKTNLNFTLQANLLWLFKLFLFLHLSTIFLFATAISIFNQPNTLKCNRSTEECILNISSTFNSDKIKIPLFRLKNAKFKNYDANSTIELITDSGKEVQLSYTGFDHRENHIATWTKIEKFINNESINILYIEQDNLKGSYWLLILSIAGGLTPLTGIVVFCFLLKNTSFDLSKNTNELKITTKSIWRTKQENYLISQIEKVELKCLIQFGSNLKIYKLNVILKSGKAKEIVVIDLPKISAAEVQKQTEELIFNH